MAATDLTGWHGRLVLVTGYSGFIGSWLCATLVELGADVHGFAADEDVHARDRAAALTRLGVAATVGEITDFDAVRRAVAAQPFDVVFHLAAQPLVSVGLSDPRGTLTTNIGGSINVLEAVRLSATPVLVHVTSDKCYRNRGWQWPYREVDEMGAGCPYSTSKAAAELVFETYTGLLTATAAASVRFGNVIGGGDYAANRLVPDILAALRANKAVTLRRPDAVRPWQHVLDVVHGLLRAATALANGSVRSGEVFNFAPPGDGAAVHELVAALVASWQRVHGRVTPMCVERNAAFPEEELLRLDGRKAARALRWTHMFGLERSAGAIVDWDHAVSTGALPIEATTRQVREFLAGTGRLHTEQRGVGHT